MSSDSDVEECDVLVAGSGAGGLSTALAAAVAGLKVIVVEKADVIGGTTAYSGGVVWIPSDGSPESVSDAMDYLAANAGNHFDARRAGAYVNNAHQALKFLSEHTGLHYEAIYFPDYNQAYRGAVKSGRSLMPANFEARLVGPRARDIRPALASTTILGGMMIPIKDIPHFANYGRSWRSFFRVARLVLRYGYDRLTLSRPGLLTGGNALIGALLKATLDRGVEIRTNSPVESLIISEKSVKGAWVRSNGRRLELRARRGVVLACGGIPHDRERRKLIDPKSGGKTGQCSLAPKENTGDGIRLGESAGAPTVTELNHHAAWAPASVVPMRDGRTVLFPHFRERARAGYILVDKRGRRFTNEAMSYMTVGAAMITASQNDDTIEAYFIGDHETIRREGLGPVPPGPLRLDGYVRSGYLKRAHTLADLAQSAGIDAAGLEATVANFNAGAVHGKDTAFNRGSDAFQLAYGTRGHKPNPCVGPILRPPFYALKLQLGDLGTFAGLPTDENARVLDSSGSEIRGLYAVGNDMASVMGGTYPGAGITIGPAITFGYLAARAIAESNNAA